VLANVAFNVILGENGIIEKATNAKEATEIAREQEIVDLSVTAVELDKKFENPTSKITVDDIGKLKEEVKNYDENAEVSKRDDVTLVVKFTKTNREYEIGLGEGEIREASPQDLFIFEVIDEEKKTAKIVTMNPKYCNKSRYDSVNHITSPEIEDTNGKINYNGKEITELIIPKTATINEKTYTIVEMNIMIAYGYGDSEMFLLPDVEVLECPNTIEKINTMDDISQKYQWSYESRLARVVLPEKIKEIPKLLFSDCYNLKEITIPDGVTKIEERAFYWSGIENINLPTTLQTIGKEAFSECNYLKSIILPPNLKTIEERAFSCSKLESVNLPSSVVTLGESVFEYCYSLKSVVLPENLTTMPNNVFYGCYPLEINIKQPEGSIEGAPWGARNPTIINWDYTGE